MKTNIKITLMRLALWAPIVLFVSASMATEIVFIGHASLAPDGAPKVSHLVDTARIARVEILPDPNGAILEALDEKESALLLVACPDKQGTNIGNRFIRAISNKIDAIAAKKSDLAQKTELFELNESCRILTGINLELFNALKKRYARAHK